MPVLSAGYILEEVTTYFIKKGHTSLLDQLAQLSLFELSPYGDVQSESVSSIFSVANNIISRGLPTRSSLYLTDRILNAIFDHSFKNILKGKICFELPLEQMEDIATGLVKGNVLQLLSGRLTEEKKLLAQLLFTPIAVARVQKIIVHLILHQVLSLKSSAWNILIIERDVPCAKLAISDLTDLLTHLLQFEGNLSALPRMNVQVVSSEEFADTPLGHLSEDAVQLHNKDILAQHFDAVIDISLRKDAYYQTPRTLKNSPFFEAKSVNHTPVHSTHTLITDQPISYAALGQVMNQHQFFFQQASKQEALIYLLQNVLRIEQLPPGLANIINRSVQGKSLVARYPNGQYRLYAVALSGLLQPAMTGIIYESALQISQDGHELSSHYFDSYRVLNQEDLKTAQLQQKIKGTLQYLFLLTTADQLFRVSILEEIKQVLKNGSVFSQLIFHEAHSISEWSHYTNYLYGAVLSEVPAIFETEEKLPVHVYSGSITYDVMMDICSSFNLDEADIIHFSDELYRNKFANYSIIPVPYSESQALLSSKQKSQVMVKYPVLKRLLKNVPFEFGKKQEEVFGPTPQGDKSIYSYGGIIFDQHVSYPPDTQLESLSKYLISEQYLDIDIFPYDPYKDNSDHPNGTDGYYQFQEKTSNLLITNYPKGNPLPSNHLRYSIHYHLPLSPEHLYEETAYSMLQREKCPTYILFHPSDIHLNEYTQRIKYQISDNKVSDAFIKEKTLFFELLEGISYPDDFFLRYLSNKLLREFGIKTRINIHRDQENVFHLSVEGTIEQSHSLQLKVYGNIYLPDLSVDALTAQHVSHSEATKVLSRASEIVQELSPSGEFANILLHNKGEGIAANLSKDLIDKTTIVLDHSNEYLQRLTDLIKTEGNYEVDTEFVGNIISLSFDAESFLETFEREYPLKINRERKYLKGQLNSSDVQKDTVGITKRLKYLTEIPDNFSISEPTKASIQQFYPRVRTRTETIRLLYRLKILGLIDKFDWDEENGLATIYVKKKSLEEITTRYTQYLSRYLGPVSISHRLKGLVIDSRAPLAALEYIVDDYLDFIHNYLAPKRINASRFVAEICKLGLKKGNSIVHEYVKHYFTELFSQREFLLSATKNNQEPTAILDKYAQFITSPPEKLDVGSEIAILKHMIKSCESIQSLLPRSNRVLNVIHAYAKLLLLSTSDNEENDPEESIEEPFLEVQNQLIEGLASLYDTSSSEYWMNILNRLKTYAMGFNEELESVFDEISNMLMVTYYSSWLAEFNNKFFDISN